jgi:hypothetical protein
MIDPRKVCIGPWPEEYESILCGICHKNDAVWARFDHASLSSVFCNEQDCRRIALPESDGAIPEDATNIP